MKHILTLLTFTLLVAGVPTLSAQNSGLENRLSRALKLYPDADADKDGKLSMEEAMKYVEAHPELKALLAAKMGGKNDGDRVSSAGSSRTTPASKGLPPGPSVFVCAHSFMIYTATLLPPLVESAGIGYQDAGKQMIGGSRVIQHWNVPDGKNRAKTTLKEGKVDVLTVSPHQLLPDEGIDNFTKLGLEMNPKLRVLVQASWPGRDGHLDKDFTNQKRDEVTAAGLQKMHEAYHSIWVKALEEQVSTLNTVVGREAVHIVPAGDAVFALRQHILAGTAPGIAKQSDLFRDPLGHPQPPLAALVTYCHFATIYGRSPIGLPVPVELRALPKAEELNLLLQKIAWEAVTRYPMSGVKADTAKPTSQP